MHAGWVVDAELTKPLIEWMDGVITNSARKNLAKAPPPSHLLSDDECSEHYHGGFTVKSYEKNGVRVEKKKSHFKKA